MNISKPITYQFMKFINPHNHITLFCQNVCKRVQDSENDNVIYIYTSYM